MRSITLKSEVDYYADSCDNRISKEDAIIISENFIDNALIKIEKEINNESILSDDNDVYISIEKVIEIIKSHLS